LPLHDPDDPRYVEGLNAIRDAHDEPESDDCDVEWTREDHLEYEWGMFRSSAQRLTASIQADLRRRYEVAEQKRPH
jgi:hypothetical protein